MPAARMHARLTSAGGRRDRNQQPPLCPHMHKFASFLQWCAVAETCGHVRPQVISFLSADGIVQFPISQSGRRVRAVLQHLH